MAETLLDIIPRRVKGPKAHYSAATYGNDIYSCTDENTFYLFGKEYHIPGLDPTSESYLTLGAAGFKLSGIQAALNTLSTTIGDHTVNGLKISTNPVITGANASVTGYTKPDTTGAIDASDTINGAIGKLEKKADNLGESLNTLSENLTNQGNTIGNYTVNGKKISTNPVLSALDIKIGKSIPYFWGKAFYSADYLISNIIGDLTNTTSSKIPSKVKKTYDNINKTTFDFCSSLSNNIEGDDVIQELKIDIYDADESTHTHGFMTAKNLKRITTLENTLNTFLNSADTSNTTINRWKEIENFLTGITDTQTLTSLLESQKGNIDNYTVNGKKISTNPVLTTSDITLGSGDDYATSLTQILLTNKPYESETPISRILYELSDTVHKSPFVRIFTSESTDTNLKYVFGTLRDGVRIEERTDNSIQIDSATTALAGLMSAADKTYLDGLPNKFTTIDTEIGTVKDICDNNTDDIANEITRAKEAEKALSDAHKVKDVDDATLAKDSNGIVSIKDGGVSTNKLSTEVNNALPKIFDLGTRTTSDELNAYITANEDNPSAFDNVFIKVTFGEDFPVNKYHTYVLRLIYDTSSPYTTYELKTEPFLIQQPDTTRSGWFYTLTYETTGYTFSKNRVQSNQIDLTTLSLNDNSVYNVFGTKYNDLILSFLGDSNKYREYRFQVNDNGLFKVGYRIEQDADPNSSDLKTYYGALQYAQFDGTDIKDSTINGTKLVDKAVTAAKLADKAVTTSKLADEVMTTINTNINQAIANVVANAPEDLNTLKEIADWISTHADSAATMNSQIQANKTAIDNAVKKTGDTMSGDLKWVKYGQCGIGEGNGDAATFETHNLKIKTWYGLGIHDYQDICRILFDARTGKVNASSFVKAGGTSSQFLKADGSVDESTYFKRQGRLGSYNIDTLAEFASRDIQPVSEITIEGEKPFDGWGTLLTFQSYVDRGGIQIAGDGGGSLYYRSIYNGTFEGVKWKQLLTTDDLKPTLRFESEDANTGTITTTTVGGLIIEHGTNGLQVTNDTKGPKLSINLRGLWNNIQNSFDGWPVEIVEDITAISPNNTSILLALKMNDLYGSSRTVLKSLPGATTEKAGVMSAADKTKLDSILSTWSGSQADYDAISSKDSNTVYYIFE